MKKTIKIMIIALLAFVLTGCVKFNFNLQITDQDNATLSMDFLVSEAFLKQGGYSQDDLKNMLSQNGIGQWTMTDKKETTDNIDYVGYHAVAPKDYVKKILDKVTVKEKENTKTYQLKISSNDIGYDSSEITSSPYGSYLSQAKKVGAQMNFVIQMPGKITKSNVGTFEDDKVTVDLLDVISGTTKIQNIEITSKEDNSSLLPLYIGIGLAILLGIIIAFIVIKKRDQTKVLSEEEIEE